MNDEAELLPGTLDLLILKAVSLGPLHGYAVLSRIEQISGRALFVEQGALYPALFRLVRQGLLKTEWGKSENNRRARIEFGGEERFKEECRETLAGNFIDALFRDVRYGTRMLMKNPGFTLMAVATLALGIGANSAVFSAFSSLILRPLPFEAPD